jgi:hypothetical protein
VLYPTCLCVKPRCFTVSHSLFYNRRFLGCQVRIHALSRHRDNDARLLHKPLCFFFFFRPPDLQNLSKFSAFCKELCVRNHAFWSASHIPGFLPICIVFSSLTHLEFQFPIWSKRSITRPSCKHFLQCHFFIACKQPSNQALSPCCIVRGLS